MSQADGTRTALKVVRRTALALALATFAGWGGVLALSEIRLRDYTEPAAFSHAIPSDSASLEWGRHLARTRGCFGCHGQQLEGEFFTEEWPWVRRAVAPNLAAFARDHEAQTLADAIRGGVGHDGRALWSMPSYNFRHLPDEDLAALIAFLRSAPVIENRLPRPSLGWQARWWLARGEEMHMADWVAGVPDLIVGPEEGAAMVRGERIAMTTCNECHGLDLRGSWQEMDIAPPDLAIVAAYPWEGFQTLMRTGTPLDGRDLGLMKLVAPDRFAAFTEEEMRDLYAFLQTLPQRPIPTGVFWRPDR